MTPTHGRMRQSEYWDDMRQHMYAPHVRGLNEFVDDLAARKSNLFIPHISPEFGGDRARLLLLNLSPGEKTKTTGLGGSGFLSVENADPAASRIGDALDEVRLDLTECSPWNLYPWYVRGLGSMPSDQQDPYIRQGATLLIYLLALLPRLRAVFIFGGATKRGWIRFGQEYPKTRSSLRSFYHRSTGPQGYIGSSEQQATWRQELHEEMARAKRWIESKP